MTRYPVDYEYSKTDIFYLGYAETEAEALALLNDGLDDEEQVSVAELQTVEAGILYKTEEQAENDFEQEIQAGYCRIAKVWGGYRANIETWKPLP